MSNLRIHFSLNNQHYEVNLSKSDVQNQIKVLVGGVEYALLGKPEGVAFIKECFESLSSYSLENLEQAGKELKSKLWMEGARDISLSNGVRQTPLDIPQTVNSICSALEENYVYPEVAKKCSDYLQKQLKEGAYEPISDIKVFAQALTADLRLISEDKHMEVTLISQPEEPLVLPLTTPLEEVIDDFNRPVLINTVEFTPATNIGWMGREKGSLPYELQTGYLSQDNTIAYMDLTVFGVCKERDNTAEMKADVANRKQAYIDAVERMSDADTIIIDLRNNDGGDPFAVQLLCSLFVDEGRPLNRIESRTADGPKSQEFNTLSREELPKERRLLDKEIYVLIGPFTFSAAEEFSNNMKVLGRATFVGEPSAGAANPGGPFQINSDLAIFIPTGRAINPIQEGNWEGVGIIPEHMVPEREAFDQAVFLIQEKKHPL